MKINVEIDVDDDIYEVLKDYANGYTIDSDYIISTGREVSEMELWPYLHGGFYDHYPLSSTELGSLIIDQIKKENGK